MFGALWFLWNAQALKWIDQNNFGDLLIFYAAGALNL